MNEKICHKCNNTFSLYDHEQGIVINDEIFICEQCHTDHSEKNVDEELTVSKQYSSNEMPIALWLIKEQNKGKTFMSRKK